MALNVKQQIKKQGFETSQRKKKTERRYTEIIIVKRLVQGRNNVTRVRVEPMFNCSCDQGRRKNDVLTLLATLPTL